MVTDPDWYDALLGDLEATGPGVVGSQGQVRVPLPVDLMSFTRPAAAADALARVMGLVHGRHR